MNTINAFDKIIGYDAVKKELMKISDTLKNREAYDRLGIKAPRGLLLYGEPGVGKSLMASAIIEESCRKTFTCRKDKPNGDFINEIKNTFKKAMQNEPSIVYLDDMDKFANGDERHPDAEEYVTVQSCIDEVKNREVFVLATANNIRCLPESLKRAGRFDRTIKIKAPSGNDAIQIVSHYLNNKNFVDSIDPVNIARIMDGRSCAELETVINEAGLYAGFERAETITMDHFMKACLHTIFNLPVELSNWENDRYLSPEEKHMISQIACHEAGHVVISEVLCPGSITLVSAIYRTAGESGLTVYYNDHSRPLHYQHISHIISSLGGMAATEQKFGIHDMGCERDLDCAFDHVRHLITNTCSCGFHLHSSEYRDSERLTSDQELAVSAEIEKYYRKAKEILSLNRDFLEKLSSALIKKGLLSYSDIQKIKSECKITSVAL